MAACLPSAAVNLSQPEHIKDWQIKYLYKIDTNFAGLNKADFTDVNDYFDKRDLDRPYPRQREWLKDGGIPGTAVSHYMNAMNFYGQVTVNATEMDLPAEGSVAGWQAMP